MYRINHISHCGFEILNGSCVLAVMSTIILLRREAFITQLVRASHRYHKVTGSNPVEVLIFFSGCPTQQYDCAQNNNKHEKISPF